MSSRRPYVILNSAMSLDGKIATRRGVFQLSSDTDRKRVHQLRSQVDAIMVGIRTVLSDDPKLTVKYVRGTNPIRIIVDSYARTPLNAYVVRTAEETQTVIAVTLNAPRQRVEKLRQAGVQILYSGRGEQVSLTSLMRELHRMGIHSVLLEGGGTLNWSMLSKRLVDIISVAISPQIVGGETAVTLAEGQGANGAKDTVKLRFLKSRRYGSDLVLYYKVLA